jgi:hypothetical protein
MFFIADFLPDGASVALRVAAFVPALLASLWFLLRLARSSLRQYPFVNPFAPVYLRALWWGLFWPNPGASRKDWVIFGIEIAAFVGMMSVPLI